MFSGALDRSSDPPPLPVSQSNERNRGWKPDMGPSSDIRRLAFCAKALCLCTEVRGRCHLRAMSISNGRWIALAGWVTGLGVVACSASTGTETHGAGKAGSSAVTTVVAQAGTGPSVGRGSTTTASAAPSGNAPAAAGGAAGSGGILKVTPPTPTEGCDSTATFKKEGCACRAGETSACWTGPVADRNVGMCHDGLQVCSGGSEFASWGACMGEQKVCGTDAGVPPPPPDDDEECSCIPGAVIQCSEDCSVGIICSLSASKTCLPDKTWSQCREEGVTLDLPGVQCRNMLHGCFGDSGDGELFVGDCSKQFKCGHAPPPVKTPPPTTDTNPT